MTSLGQFYPVASPVHDLDPRAKIVATAVLVVGLFLIDSTAASCSSRRRSWRSWPRAAYRCAISCAS